MKMKYNDSRKRNNLVMRTILILGFDSIENHNSYRLKKGNYTEFIYYIFWGRQVNSDLT